MAYLKVIFLPAVFLLLALQVNAQTCTGSLGDPVINETFGRGSDVAPTGPPLPVNVTTYNYSATSCPSDGSYTIARGTGVCFGNTWKIVAHDHTGDINGYMMIINSSVNPGVFYTQRASGNKLCPNTTYEFAAWIMNLIYDEAATKGDVEPNITFSVETVNGKILKTYTTGNIQQDTSLQYHKYGTFFTSPSDGSDVIVKMINNAPGGYGNDLILDDITFRPCGAVIQAGFFNITETAAQNLCADQSAGTFILKGQQTGYNNPSYQWQKSLNNGVGWQDIPGATETILNVTVNPGNGTGTFLYRMGVLESTATTLACRIYSQPLAINVNALPVTGVLKNPKICEGEQLQLYAAGGVTYQWTGPNNFSSTEPNPVITNHADNTYNGVYKVTVINDKGCVATDAATFTVLPRVNPHVSGGFTICSGDVVQLHADGGIAYKWTPATGLDHDDVQNPVAKPDVTTSYSVSIFNGACTDDTQSVLVTVSEKPAAKASDDIKIQEGQSVKLKGIVAGDNVRYYWTPSDFLDDPASLTPVAAPIENTTYTLHAESQDGCGMAADQVFIRVYRNIIIPNTFSPNNDGKNDLWNIDKLDTYPESTLTVFTRGGQQIFRSVGNAIAWDGNYNGRQLPATTYYYVLDLKNNMPVRSGWVLLVR